MVSYRLETYGIDLQHVHESCSSAPLGLESGKMLDGQIQASSALDSNYLAVRSRLNTQRDGSLGGGWSPPANKNLIENSWIQVDFLQPTIVTHIGTQGRADLNEYVTKYAVQFGFDVHNLIDFENGKIFDGNIDQNTVKTNFLEIPIITRYIRVIPKEFYGHVTMRWELYGCVADFQCKVNVLGMKSKAISDSKISSSTALGANHSAVRSRLDTTVDNAGLGAWIPDPTDRNPWIQVELTKLNRVTRIDTQGRSDAPEWVKTYKLGFGLYKENTTFIDYENGKVFPANTDHNTTVTNDLDPPLTARFIRLYPLTFEVSRSLRWELYGCVPEPCDDPLGMQTGIILDKKITASSAFSSNTSASRGRLGLMMHDSLAGGWRAAENDNSPWIQIELSSETTVTRIAVQGRSDVSQWVKTYSLLYGIRDGKLHDYKNGTVFNASTDQNNVVSSILDPPILARYVRLLPQTYHGAVALRMELYGCLQEFCDQALGMQSRALPNESITASTSRSSGYEPFYARLGNRGEGVNLNGAWAPLEIAVNTSWIQVDLLQPTTVSRIATQGHPDLVQWVMDYSIEYGTIEGNLMEYENRLNEKVFKGNTDQNTIVFNVLDPPIFARYVRILPKSYQTYVSIRLELYGGCDSIGNKVVPVI
ncbi:hemocytin-like [Actinia tenebrosa]|uniref:Hemocytin-like n=1 Tax=Actinia tenebrosa TaxID=6105 RepID=A0A6P8I2A7_ACTTE|nr:hemocytin-like [Actinia tenebrosa]